MEINPMLELRERALRMQPEDIGLTKENFPHDVWGILMETGYEDGFFTLLTMADGTCSLYFSGGGGILGAGEHENVVAGAEHFLNGANFLFSRTTPVSETPIPAAGHVNFYFLTHKGVHAYSAPEMKLDEGKDELSPLFHAAHAVIYEMRQIEGIEE